MTRIFLIICTIFCFSLAKAQEGKVQIIKNDRIDSLVQKHILYNKQLKGNPGYRVQIFFDSGNNARKKATDIRAEFMEKYPQVPAYLIFQEPYFKVRVGDFRTRLDAERFKKLIEGNYTNTFIVKDLIKQPSLDSSF